MLYVTASDALHCTWLGSSCSALKARLSLKVCGKSVCRKLVTNAWFYTPVAMEMIRPPEFTYLDGWMNTFGNAVYLRKNGTNWRKNLSHSVHRMLACCYYCISLVTSPCLLLKLARFVCVWVGVYFVYPCQMFIFSHSVRLAHHIPSAVAADLDGSASVNCNTIWISFPAQEMQPGSGHLCG